MPNPASHAFLSVSDYLAHEDGSDCRHEYIDGQIYSMTGASRAHNLITLNIATHLRPLLRGTSCQVFANDMKVRLRIAEQDIFYYPDLVLTCDPADRETYYCTAPCLLIEVLSESTARIDRREKFLSYQMIMSLEEYWVVEQSERRLSIHRRAQGWVTETILKGSVRLSCLDRDIPLDVIYEDVIQA